MNKHGIEVAPSITQSQEDIDTNMRVDELRDNKHQDELTEQHEAKNEKFNSDALSGLI